ncbi:VipE [Legionella gratiana]|uniref:VipE n=1 Tax=Legionella gratiana TaxID=45066 RepID=A0A378JBA1_9GAMM|nr:hypothetical protein [Legionella gratiana]KTD15513.1 VipE [Legionella gratiana]STX45144.1 VipE [Legionella gratiana]
MPLQQTRNLMKKYGKSLTDGTISDQMLDDLLHPDTFKRSPGIAYVDPNKPITDSNHTQMDAIKDFVETIGEELSPAVLHTLTGRIIQRAPDRGENTFMRNSTLEKAFLAYEMVRCPELAASHFDSLRIKTTFPRETDISNLKTVILSPLIEFFSSTSPLVHYKKALQKLKEQLQQDDLNAQIKEHAQKVMSHIEALKAEGNESIIDLTKVLKDTQSLLKGEMSVKDYQTEAKTVQGKPSAGMKILGGLMIALGLAAVAAGIALAVTGVGLVAGAVTAGVGVGVLATGIGLFAKGRHSGLSKAMNDLAITKEHQTIIATH